jgi:hypothetical protein
MPLLTAVNMVLVISCADYGWRFALAATVGALIVLGNDPEPGAQP